MVMTVVLVDCELCKKETEAKFKDCDSCYERYLDQGGEPDRYDDTFCNHFVCLECGEDPYGI